MEVNKMLNFKRISKRASIMPKLEKSTMTDVQPEPSARSSSKQIIALKNQISLNKSDIPIDNDASDHEDYTLRPVAESMIDYRDSTKSVDRRVVHQYTNSYDDSVGRSSVQQKEEAANLSIVIKTTKNEIRESSKNHQKQIKTKSGLLKSSEYLDNFFGKKDVATSKDSIDITEHKMTEKLNTNFRPCKECGAFNSVFNTPDVPLDHICGKVIVPMVDEKGVQAGKPFHQWLQSRTAFMNKKYNASYNTGPQAHNSKWDKRGVSASKYWFHVKNNNESMVKNGKHLNSRNNNLFPNHTEALKNFRITGFRSTDVINRPDLSQVGKSTESDDLFKNRDYTNDHEHPLDDSIESSKDRIRSDKMQQLYRSKQNSFPNSRASHKKNNMKHPWLLDGLKYSKMKLIEKSWEKNVTSNMNSTFRNQNSNGDLNHFIPIHNKTQDHTPDTRDMSVKHHRSDMISLSKEIHTNSSKVIKKENYLDQPVVEQNEDSSVYIRNAQSRHSSSNIKSGASPSLIHEVMDITTMQNEHFDTIHDVVVERVPKTTHNQTVFGDSHNRHIFSNKMVKVSGAPSN